MAKRRFQLSETEERALLSAFGDCKDGPTRTRFQALRLYGQGYTTEEIEKITGICRSTLMDWVQKYRQGDIEALKDHRLGGNRALLTEEQLQDLKQRLHTYRPDQLFGSTVASASGQFWTVMDLARAVEMWYGVRYARQGSYVQLFKRCEFSYQRPDKVYKSRSEAKVQAFEEELSEKKLDVAQEAPDTVWLAEDEASLYLQPTTSRVWAPRGQTPVVRAHPGREKISFYGTLNLLSGQEMAMPSAVMNGEASAQHLQRILDSYPDVPIVLLWDRAPWHFGAPIRELLEAHPRLEIIHFPVAAPDLNPQEHVWKAARRAVSHNHLVERLPDLADRFEHHLLSNTFRPSLLDDPVFQMVCAMSK